MIQKIKCFIGFHTWDYRRALVSMREYRQCVHCKKHEWPEEIVIKNWE